MSTQRGKIKIEGFHSDVVEDRDLSEWTDEKSADVPSRWKLVARQLVRDRLALTGALFVAFLLFWAVFSRPIVVEGFTVQPFSAVPYDPEATLIGDKYESPSMDHPFGTDRLGRDLFSRVMFASRFSATIGLIVTAISVSFGVVYGGISGYFGGKVDDLMMRFVDLVFAFPQLILTIVIVTMLGRGYWALVGAFVAAGWAGYARLIRGEILKVKQNEYVMAAKALGARDRRVIFRHVVPNAIGPVIVQATLAIGTVVIGIAALGFLGIGFNPGTPEWGTILNAEKATVISAGGEWQWWATVFPGVVIFIFVMALNMIGDAINDALDAQNETADKMG
jgi:peptide/nickel transport system permease protein